MATRVDRLPPLLAGLMVVSACAADGRGGDASCARAEPLVSGVEHAELLGLSDAEENAVVDLVFALPGGEEHCSGALVADGWVLTADHCRRGEPAPSVTVRVGRSAARPDLTASSTSVRSHPSLDLMLVEVDLPGSPGLSPLAPAEDSWPARSDDRAQLAGYGRDAGGRAGERSFAVERVAEVTESAIVVDGGGISGGCAGDSGGPLLGRDGAGRPAVLGVLSEGSATCRGRDAYVRVDAARDWLAESVPGRPSPAPPPCGTIEAAGRCLGARALRCAGGALEALDCAGAACGWDAGRGAFGCVARGADPCGGVPREGACDGDVAVYCREGALERYDCARCVSGGVSGGHLCVLSPASGGAACLR